MFRFSTSLFGYAREQVLSYLYRLQTGRDKELNELQKEIDRVKLENDFLAEECEQLRGKSGESSMDLSALKFAVGKAGEFVSAVNAAGKKTEIANSRKQVESKYDKKIRYYGLAMEQLEKKLLVLLQNGGTFSNWEEISEWENLDCDFNALKSELDAVNEEQPSGRAKKYSDLDPERNDENRKIFGAESEQNETGEEKTKLGADADLNLAKNKYMLNKITGKDMTDERGEVIIPKDTAIDDDVIAKADSMGKLAELIVNMTLPSVPA